MNTEGGTWSADNLRGGGDVSAVTETLQIEGQVYCCV